MKLKNFKNKFTITLVALSIFGFGSVDFTQARTINFADYTWDVKETASGTTMGPGANNWGSTVENDQNDVYVDNDKKLHLFVSQRPDGQWYSSEVTLDHSLGYGKYTFEINSDVNNLDQNLVAAPFLYQDDTHEIDIEHSYWAGESNGKNLYYTVQPVKNGSQQTQTVSLSNPFLDIIDWQSDKIIFTTEQNGNTISSFTYASSTDSTTNNFIPGSEKVHINFWQYQGKTPTNSSTSEFIIKNFTFDPFVAPIIASSSTSTTDQTATSTTATTSTPITSTSSTQTTSYSRLTIRYNENLILLNKDIALTTTTYHDIINNIDYPLIDTSTVFSLLVNADQQNDNFYISDAQLSAWLNNFYVKCINITIASSTENKCNNWQYTVNSIYPSVGMDKMVLSGGENVYIYFGNRYDLSTEKNIFSTNETITTTFKEYDYQTNNWTLLDNKLLLATDPILPDYSNWPPATKDTATTTNGLGYFNFSATGTYYLTIPNDYWPGVTISVTSTPVATTTQTSTSTNNGGGGSGNTQTNSLIPQSTIDDIVNKLINFLKSKQDNDGKIIDGNISDWAAMSFASRDIYAADVKKGDKSLYDFIYNYNFTDNSDINLCASYPRHILALLAAGTDQSDDKITNLKNKINAECVKNNKFGQDGINDDIFGLLALLALGQDINSSSVQTAFNAILADQQTDGSFTWNGFSGADITGAVMDTLFYAKKKGLNFDNNVLEKAKQYLKNQQLSDGGWGFGASDALTTSWAVMGINGTAQDQEQWFNSSGKNPWYVLTTLDNDHYTQSWDGNIDWFATKHAIPALVGAHWPIILNPKPQTTSISVNTSGGGSSIATILATTTIITTTTVTTTTNIATSTTSTLINTVVTNNDIDNNFVIKTPISKTKPDNKPISVIPETIKKEIVTTSKNTKKEPTNLAATTQNNSDTKPQQELNAGQPQNNQNKTLDDLPLDTPTKRNAKKILAVSGGSALAVGAYLGLRLLRNVI
jgi:hypothetical protein